jgi:hypothetical protein
MRIEKLLRGYLCRELLQCPVDDLRRAQKRSGAAVLLEVGQQIGRVSWTQGNAPYRNDLRYLPVNTRDRGPPRQRTGHGMPNRAARSRDLVCCRIHCLKLWSTSALRSTGIHRERAQEIGVVPERVCSDRIGRVDCNPEVLTNTESQRRPRLGQVGAFFASRLSFR